MGDEQQPETTPNRGPDEPTFSLPGAPSPNAPPPSVPSPSVPPLTTPTPSTPTPSVPSPSPSTPSPSVPPPSTSPASVPAPPPYTSYEAPLPYTPYAPPAVGQSSRGNPQATASLVLGIVSMVASIVFVTAIVGIVLGIVGWLRSHRTAPPVGRAKAVVGIALSALSIAIGAVLVDQIATGVRSGLAGLEQAMEEGAPTAGATESAPPVLDLADFIQVDAAEWASIVEDPERARGRPVVVFAEVVQFDNTTGPDRFLASAGVDQPGELELQTNTLVVGDEELLDDVETGDVLKVYAVVTESWEYENQIGGTATVPVLNVAQFEDVGFADLSTDVELGTTATSEIGWVTLPATVTNSSQRTRTYAVDVVAESEDGSTSYATGTGYAEDLEPGQTEEITVNFFEEVPADAVFRIETVERYGE